MATDIDKFVHDQLSVWPAVAAKYRALKSARTRTLPFRGLVVTLQSNPGRLPIIESGCPLCEENYLEHQHVLPFEGRKGRKYNILVNRAPIFPNHLVITRDIHSPQTIWHRFPDMLDLAAKLENYIVFYNSPGSGTSVPGHAHFQACPKGYMPLERLSERLLRAAAGGETPEELRYIDAVRDASLYHYSRFVRGVFLLRARTPKSMAKMFYRLLDCLNLALEETEPRFNALTYCSEGEYRAVVMLRGATRSAALDIAPGTADMAGFVVLPEPSDFGRITPALLESLYEDVALSEADEKRLLWRLTRTQPRVEVGIASAAALRFEIISDGAGPQEVTYREGKIDYNGVLYDELVFEAVTISTLFAEPSFILYTEGEQRRFAGTLKFIVDAGRVQAVNLLGAEDYLLSVISLLPPAEREARIRETRAWLMEQMARRQAGRPLRGGPTLVSTPGVVTWLEHRDSASSLPDVPSGHARFDVCAGEHCRLYIGLTPSADTHARSLIDRTWGE